MCARIHTHDARTHAHTHAPFTALLSIRMRLLLLPKSRTAFDTVVTSYREFARLVNADMLAQAWPLAAYMDWGMLQVLQSTDWELRNTVDHEMHRTLEMGRTTLLNRLVTACARYDGNC